MARDEKVARGIMKLLGDGEFILANQLTDIMGNHNSVSFRLSYVHTQGRCNKIAVTLWDDGTYGIETFWIGDGRSTLVHGEVGIKAESLRARLIVMAGIKRAA